ncbi:MAG: CcdB family protein, partial [Acetobacteraceae bacterium]|nr:CcdB family protein [Acetobacteraceae bacterium]
MAQFDVYRNPGSRRATHPYLVVVQSNRYSQLATRLVMPLVLRTIAASADILENYLTPGFTIEGREVFLNPFDTTPVPVQRLGDPVATFIEDDRARSAIIRAIDEVLSQ